MHKERHHPMQHVCVSVCAGNSERARQKLRACNCGANCRTCVPHPESCAQAPPVWCSRSLLMRRGIITKPPQNGPWRTQATPRASHALLKYIPALRFWSKVLALYAHKKKIGHTFGLTFPVVGSSKKLSGPNNLRIINHK